MVQVFRARIWEVRVESHADAGGAGFVVGEVVDGEDMHSRGVLACFWGVG